jgi:hypothetical protein
MKKLLKDLTYLSGLRDRQTIDFAPVKLVALSDLWRFTALLACGELIEPADDTGEVDFF